MDALTPCSICGAPATLWLTEMHKYQVGRVHFCADCAGGIFAWKNDASVLLGDSLEKLRPLEIAPQTILQAREASIQARLANARLRLHSAIAAESYEEAALWRDEVRRLTASAGLLAQ